MSASHAFTVTLDDPCLPNMTIPTFPSPVQFLSDPDTGLSVVPTMSITGYEWCLVNIILTLTKDSLPNSDGFVTWADQINASITSLASTVIYFNTAAYNLPYLGVYTVSLEYTWSTATPVVKTFTFTVTDPCLTAITPPTSIAPYTANIGDPDYQQDIAPTIGVTYQNYCVFSITLTSVK